MSSVTYPTMGQCLETAGKLIALQSRRLVVLAGAITQVRGALTAKDESGKALPDKEKLDIIQKAVQGASS